MEPLFGRKLRKVTGELILSAIIVSFIEEGVLSYLGFLTYNGIEGILSATLVLSIIEIILIILLEEFLIEAKTRVQKSINKRNAKKRSKNYRKTI